MYPIPTPYLSLTVPTDLIISSRHLKIMSILVLNFRSTRVSRKLDLETGLSLIVIYRILDLYKVLLYIYTSESKGNSLESGYPLLNVYIRKSFINF